MAGPTQAPNIYLPATIPLLSPDGTMARPWLNALNALFLATVQGPALGSATDGDVAVWNGVSGRLLRDGGTVVPGPVLFADLPAVPVLGMFYVVSDSTVNLWGTPVAGGGAFQVLAFYNGSAWTVMAV